MVVLFFVVIALLRCKKQVPDSEPVAPEAVRSTKLCSCPSCRIAEVGIGQQSEQMQIINHSTAFHQRSPTLVLNRSKGNQATCTQFRFSVSGDCNEKGTVRGEIYPRAVLSMSQA